MVSCKLLFGRQVGGATTQVMDSLDDQIAVLTGASSGIGKTISLSLAGRGAEV